MRLYGAINNPLKLYGLHDFKQNATRAKAQIKESEWRIEDLQGKRNAVNSHLENQRAMLGSDLSQEIESAQELHNALALKIDLQVPPSEAIPQAELRDTELDRLEANARILRDPTMLQTVYGHLERRYGTTIHGIERIGSRANDALKATTEWLANLNEQIQSFIENREFFPLLIRTTSGSEQTATLHDLATKPITENMLSRLFSGTRADRSILEEALNQHYADLREEQDASQHFLKSISEIADGYRERMAIQTPARLQEAFNGSAFTETESLAIQLPFATGGPNSRITASYNSNTATLNDPTQSREIRATTAATPQLHAADHLQDIRQTINHIAAQNAANNETAIETEMAEAESTASQSVAILI